MLERVVQTNLYSPRLLLAQRGAGVRGVRGVLDDWRSALERRVHHSAAAGRSHASVTLVRLSAATRRPSAALRSTTTSHGLAVDAQEEPQREKCIVQRRQYENQREVRETIQKTLVRSRCRARAGHRARGGLQRAGGLRGLRVHRPHLEGVPAEEGGQARRRSAAPAARLHHQRAQRATPGEQRARAPAHAQTQQRVPSAARGHPPREDGQEAVQDRDADAGQELHQSPDHHHPGHVGGLPALRRDPVAGQRRQTPAVLPATFGGGGRRGAHPVPH